jgi:hypothetical protein
MADLKISALPAATTPLAGTEVLPIVQSGSTVKVSVANLTAGREVSAESVLITNNVGIGTTSPLVRLEVAGTTGANQAIVTASISGTTMTVTAVSSGTIVVGNLIHGTNVEPYTRVTAFGTGTGGLGTYTVSVSQTVTSTTVSVNEAYGNTIIRITNTDLTENTGQPTGVLQFFTSDSSSPTEGVGAYVAAMSESATPDTALVFGTRDNAGGGVDANERMRLDSSGNLGIGTASPGAKLDVAGNAIISVTDNTNAALRITQLGTGNALLVEDTTNPDSTPFSIDTNGFVLAGSTNGYGINGVAVPRILSVATDQSASVGANNWGTNTGAGGTIQLLKSSSGTIGTRSVVTNGTTLGMLRIAGDDGTNFIEAARIDAAVDGTPGTNDMPGRLVFSTTADGASSPTERMRIDSAGAVSIGGGAMSGGLVLDITKAQTGGVSGYTVNARINPLADVTNNSTGFQTFAINGVGTSTTNFFHYTANQGTFAGTAPTNQYGFNVANSLTGATNNYGFVSNIASGANRWNFYANGTARNYMAADLTVNGATAIPAGGTAGAGLMVSTTANFGVFFGSGAPTLSAAKGSLYLRSDGSTVNDRMYVNTNGSTTWTSVVTSA